MNTVNSSSLIQSFDLSRLIEEVDIDKLLPIIEKQVDIGKLLPVLDEELDITNLQSIIEGLDIGNLIPIISEKVDIDELLSILFSGETLLPIDDTDGIDKTFSIVLPEETVQLLDGLLLEVLPVETLAEIDAAIDIDRLFSITLPTEMFSIVSHAILSNEAVDIGRLLSVILPGDEFHPAHNNSKDYHHDHYDNHKHHQDDHGSGDDDQTFSIILPEETVQLLDGLLLEILPVETLAKIDEAIDINKLFSITLPTETFSVAREAIATSDLVDIDTLLSTVLSDEEFHPAHNNSKDYHHDHYDNHKHHQDDHGSGDDDQTFSIILPEETVQLLDGLLLEILPVETLAKIDEAIDINKLFSITLPTETFSVAGDAIRANELIDIDDLVSTILAGDKSDDETFSFIIPEETLELADGLLFEILPIETLAQIDSAIEVDRLFSIELPMETFQLVNEAVIENRDEIDVDIQNILATILPSDATILADDAMNNNQFFIFPEVALI